MSILNATNSTVKLNKGDKINISKTVENLNEIIIGLGWDIAKDNRFSLKNQGIFRKLFNKKKVSNNQDIDCDTWVAVLDSEKDSIETIYFGNLHNRANNIRHMEDNITGEGKDNEQIIVDLPDIDENAAELLVGITVYGAESCNTFVRIVDKDSDCELCRYEHKNLSSNEEDTNFIVGRFMRNNNDWEFEALGMTSGENTLLETIRKYK